MIHACLDCNAYFPYIEHESIAKTKRCKKIQCKEFSQCDNRGSDNKNIGKPVFLCLFCSFCYFLGFPMYMKWMGKKVSERMEKCQFSSLKIISFPFSFCMWCSFLGFEVCV